ncbi:collagenase [Streptomyces sp. NBC_01525]|uniref:collagenase n=1 Tax=Streptomyces sp. NBC_01525 TaxID=2903893 RepID=UPI003865E369
MVMTALTLCLGLALLAAAPGRAAAGTGAARTKAPQPRSALAPRPATPTTADELHRPDAAHAAEPATSPSHRPPLSTVKAAPRKASGKDTEAACAVSDFTSKTGDALVQQIKGSETDCINTLFSVAGQDAKALFREEQMVTVANALRAASADYPGDNTGSMTQMVLYLRAGYYVQYGNPEDVGPYGSALKSAIQGALDAFFASPHAFDVSEANGETLAETVTLIDSSSENARFLTVLTRLLKDYNSSYNAFWWMVSAVNNSYTVLFRGHWLPEFVSAVQADPSVLTVLRGFAVAHDDLLGTDKSYLVSNAGRELGRFLQHAELREQTSPLVKELLGRSEITGRTAPLWVGLAEMTDAYDKGNCSLYGTCDLQNRVRDAVLKDKHTCGPTLRIVAQQMTDADFTATCDSLLKQDAYFHSVVKDNGPVANDNNSTIEVVVFDSSAEYQTYAGIIYGISTDNGGMYLEGDPAKEGNLPRFIAYEAEWERPDFAIWNLNHEYTHYLDGRFDMYGDFEENMKTPTVMWVEGFAEYISYSYRGLTYDNAITEAGKGTYKLSTLFDTTYENTDTTRTYPWGYLAVRYLIQSHPQDVDTLLGHYRKGDWAAARTLLTETIGTRYDADFADWLAKCSAGSCDSTTHA